MVNLISLAVFLASMGNPPQQIIAPREKFVFFCKMDSLTSEERTNISKILDELMGTSPNVRELADGYELHFAPRSKGLFSKAATWCSYESRCCPFFDLAVSGKANGGAVTLRITGPAGVKKFIAVDLPKLHQLTRR